MKTRRVPFDIERAKAGAKIVTAKGKPVRILDYNLKCRDTPIVAAVMVDTFELVFCFKSNGKHECKSLSEHNLFIEEEVKPRRMTYSELAKWLRECPNEFRELKNEYNGVILYALSYREIQADDPVPERIVIRRNYGSWQEPLVEI